MVTIQGRGEGVRGHRRSLGIPAACLLAVLGAGCSSEDAPHPSGTLDASFAQAGIATTQAGTSSYVEELAIQSDGKIVAVGNADPGGSENLALLRYNADGSPDATFGSGGVVITTLGTGSSGAGVKVLGNGKIVVAGHYYTGTNYDWVLLRYDADGSPDTTFDADGRVTTVMTSSNDYVTALAVQPDGKYVVGGLSNNGVNSDLALVRYNADGSLDTTFDSDGRVVTDLGGYEDLRALALQPDGKIVGAGSTINGLIVVRYNANGSLDTTFDGDGVATFADGSAYAVAIQGDGKIVAGGKGLGDFFLVRCNANGTPDVTFGGDGVVTTDLGASDEIYGIAVLGDGRIVAGGYSESPLPADFALVRYEADGSLDLTFGTDGTVTTDIGVGTSDYAYALAIQPDGRILLAGSSDDGVARLTLARYWP